MARLQITRNLPESGLALNHAYGLPLIPGSSLKGLANHYCHSVWGETDAEYKRKGKYHTLLFGSSDDRAPDAGAIIFHDAWITPETAADSLRHDVVAPHHPHWMAKDGKEPAAPPSDFDSPRPIRFLSVSGTFHVAVSWNGPPHDHAKRWTERARLLLTNALDDWGVGGKTNAGYGRLVRGKVAPDCPPPAGNPSAPPDERVEVTVIEAKPKAGPAAFSVQEEGKPKGMLVHGTPPNPLPQIGDKIRVFWERTSGANSPQYRWTKTVAPAPPTNNKSRGGPRR